MYQTKILFDSVILIINQPKDMNLWTKDQGNDSLFWHLINDQLLLLVWYFLIINPLTTTRLPSHVTMLAPLRGRVLFVPSFYNHLCNLPNFYIFIEKASCQPLSSSLDWFRLLDSLALQISVTIHASFICVTSLNY